MTQVQPDRPPAADALSEPFTPGAVQPGGARRVSRDPGRAGAGPLSDPRTREFVEEWRNASYNCFSPAAVLPRGLSGHPGRAQRVSTPTAFHANVIAMERGELDVADVAADYVNCTRVALSCAARTPCSPATSTASARAPSTSSRPSVRWPSRVDPPAAVAVLERAHRPAHARAGARGDSVSQDKVRDWAEGLDIPIGGETILFVDCEAAFYRTSVPRAVAQMLQMAGYEFGLMQEQWRRGGPAAEMGYVDQAKKFARHNLDNCARPAPGGSWSSTCTTTSASPRTTRSTSARSSTSRSSS